MKRDVRYRLDIDYYTKEYDDRCLEISSPIYTKKEGWSEYRKAIKENCIDDKSKPARVHFWKYGWTGEPWKSELNIITIAKNY